MTKLRGVTVALFASAMLCYAMVGAVLGSVLAVVGVLLELAGWASLISDLRRRPSHGKATDRPADRDS